ncbi:hypothetical protein BN134_2008 [Cronobacter dublinensis 1210]|uniref:Uncharacterized protein n=1 Tax=Cronobacter dublinensis 1210 TaxID=1208656 RepID=A0ABP1W6Y8_9ENTR|nr:hypothetical protein BN134_2008 [Cronobacter dublinensis 1210]
MTASIAQTSADKKKRGGTRKKGFKHQSLLQIFLFLLLLYDRSLPSRQGR